MYTEENGNKKIIVIIVSLFALIVFIVCGWLIYNKFFNSKEEFNDNWSEEDFKNYNFVDEKNNKIDVAYMKKLNDKYLAIETEGDRMTNAAYIFDVSQKKIVLSEIDNVSDSFVVQFTNMYENDNYIVVNNKCLATCDDYYSKIYTKDLKLISDDFANYSLNENEIAIINSNYVKVFDVNGNVTKNISNYKNIIDFEKNYILYLDNRNINITNVDSKGLVATVGTLDEDETLDYGHIDLDENGSYYGVAVYTKSELITYEETINDMEKDDAYDPGENGFGYDDIEELRYYEREYIYSYNFITKESSKRAIFINFE